MESKVRQGPQLSQRTKSQRIEDSLRWFTRKEIVKVQKEGW